MTSTLAGSAVRYKPITNSNNCRDVIVFVGLVVDQVLDEAKLQKAAVKLIAKWPLLGGKIITSTSPYSLEEGNTVDFKSRNIDKTLEEYLPVDLRVSRSDTPTYIDIPGGIKCDELFHFDSMGTYKVIPDSLLAIRVTVLKNATLFGFRTPHYLCNAAHLRRIISAYTAILSGNEVPKLILPPDADGSLLSSLIVSNSQPSLPPGVSLEDVPECKLAECKTVGAWGGLPYILWVIFTTILSRLFTAYRLHEKYIYLPGSLVESWQAQCQKELDDGGWKSGSPAPKLSKLDIVTSWYLQKTYAHGPPDPDPIQMTYGFDYRPFLPPPPAGSQYLKNTAFEIHYCWRFSDFQAFSLASLAASIRIKVLASKQSSMLRCNLEFLETHATSTPFNLRPNAKNRLDRSAIVSSWGEDFARLDFSGASVGDGKAKVVLIMPRNVLPSGLLVKGLSFVSKDLDGGYWIRANLGRREWRGHGFGQDM